MFMSHYATEVCKCPAFSLCRVPYTIFLLRLFIAKINDSPEVLRRDIDEKAKWPIRMAIVGVVLQELIVFPKFTTQESLRHLYAFLLAGIKKEICKHEGGTEKQSYRQQADKDGYDDKYPFELFIHLFLLFDE